MLGMIFFSLFWFIQFEKDPYHFCKDSPDPKFTEDYYVCWPFDFELKKGIAEKHLETPWIDGETEHERRKSRYNRNQGAEPEVFQNDGLKRIDDKDMKNEDN
jgi:hypothetical protein